MADFYFRDDMEAEKERQAQNGPVTLAAPTQPAPAAPVQPKPDANPFQALGAAMPKPAAKPDYFADFRASLDAQNPFKQQIQGAVTDTLKNPTAAFDAQASAERDRQAREASAGREEARQRSVLAYGGNQTGQVDRTLGVLDDKETLRQAEFGRDVAAGRAQAAETARANAIGQGAALLGQEQQAAAQAAGIGLQQSGQDLDAALRREGMAQDAALTREGFKVQKEEGAAERDIRKELTYAGIGSQERMQLSGQVHDSTQRELDRTLEKLLSNDRIKASFTLAEMDAELQERMQERGFINTKELETMRADLAERLQAKGFDQETATLLAQQKFSEMEANRDRLHDERMTDIKQKWATGERIETQEWDSTMRDLDRRQEDLLTRLQIASNEGMNTERIQAEISENAKARASTEMMAAAQLAQSDKQFMRELQQRYQFDMEDLKLRRTELQGQMKLMGLQGQQLEQAIADSKVSSALDMVSLGMEMGDGSKESLAPFVEALGNTLETFFKGQGIDISSSDFMKAMTTTNAPPAPGAGGWTTGTAKPPTVDVVEDGVSLLRSLTNQLAAGTDIKKLETALSSLGTYWAQYGKDSYERGELMSDPYAVATVMNAIGPMYRARLDKPTIKKIASFLPGDVVDKVLANTGVQ